MPDTDTYQYIGPYFVNAFALHAHSDLGVVHQHDGGALPHTHEPGHHLLDPKYNRPDPTDQEPDMPATDPHILAGAEAHAASANERFEQRVDVIARQLHVLADSVTAVADGSSYDDRGAIPPRSAKAQAIVHLVTWKLANLDLGDLTAVAAEADLLAATVAHLKES